jgi:hypothetical protein
MVMTDAEERLFRALIENAADESLNPTDEWEQEMARWFFYGDEYEFLHQWLYDCPGNGYREKLEYLWMVCENDPEMSRKYRLELRKTGVNSERNARLHYDKSKPLPNSWHESNARKERDEKGRYK